MKTKKDIRRKGLCVIWALMSAMPAMLAAAESPPQQVKAASAPGRPEARGIADFDPKAQVEHFLQTRQSLASDPYRPLYHFAPPGYGTHDPAGLCWWQGKYHLFYLLSVPGVLWGRGHAVSDDLVHWSDLPMLSKAFRGGTGQVWADKERAIMSRPMSTASDPMLANWIEQPTKLGGDSFLWREADTYYFTATIRGTTTALALWRSTDLEQWTPMGRFLEDVSFTDPGTDCSCPNILPLGNGKHLVLFFSHNQGPQYYIGTMDLQKGRFAVEEHGKMNYGPVMRGSLHAPTAVVDPLGRCIGMWNVFEGVIKESFTGSKNGVMSLPRHLSLNPQATGNGRDKRNLNPLCVEPVEELKKLRFNPVHVGNLSIPANGETVLSGVRGRAVELEAVIDPGKAREVGLRILRSPDAAEYTTISLSMHAWAWPWASLKRELMVDVSQASLSPDVASRTPEIGPLFLKDGEPLRLRVFIDRSIVEVYANGRQCLTMRAYPTRSDSVGVSVFARGNEATLISLDAYQMRSIWPELKGQEGL
jgi:beta-fructofuranosidase